ncbi:MAG: phosphatidylglycerophosphatase A family protein [Candidatus Wenzhouxiangella sp. M2_3B_020]
MAEPRRTAARIRRSLTASDPATIEAALSTPGGLLAFGLGAGLSRWAPGTVGTLVGMPLAIPLIGIPQWAALLVIAMAFVAGVFICHRVSLTLGVHDHGGIVIDEIVAVWLVLLFVPPHWAWWLAAFFAFRLFDIVKPWPIGWLDKRLAGGFGIMVDDVVAAGYALAVLGFVHWLAGG